MRRSNTKEIQRQAKSILRRILGSFPLFVVCMLDVMMLKEISDAPCAGVSDQYVN